MSAMLCLLNNMSVIFKMHLLWSFVSNLHKTLHTDVFYMGLNNSGGFMSESYFKLSKTQQQQPKTHGF